MPPRTVARVAGAVYLAFVLVSVLAGLVGHIGMGGSAQVYDSIITNPWSFRLALVFAYLSAFFFLVAAWGLYVLLRPVNGHLALLFLLLNAVGVGIQCASMIPLISALLQQDGAGHLQSYSADQLKDLAYLSIDVYKTAFATAQLFFGTWLFPLGYLVFKSGFLPRILGVILMIDGVGVMIWFLQALLLPAYPAISYPSFVIGFIAEVGLALWLLIMAVKVEPAEGGRTGK
ncbi:hypothetical protein IWX89_001660 [Cryobacterium sp. MP_M3]|uniref:DUF4386 domain-containing protein n=1 Tax=unclassified Cryobacterium TaxID=2649013 RepID=UPI0018CB6780|nr:MULTISPECIES: DUF4386 domain-containing protein [unclassified Cryobacterium]MBG6058218.1 hypothetical protein [Cryobacterium sp. MP_M3]